MRNWRGFDDRFNFVLKELSSVFENSVENLINKVYNFALYNMSDYDIYCNAANELSNYDIHNQEMPSNDIHNQELTNLLGNMSFGMGSPQEQNVKNKKERRFSHICECFTKTPGLQFVISLFPEDLQFVIFLFYNFLEG